MGRDKATLPMPGTVGGETLIEHVTGAVARRCAPVFVIAARGQSLPGLSAQVLYDEITGAGPLPALGHGLRAAATAGAEWAFVCAVDMPLFDVALVDALAAVEADAEIVLPWDGRDHYLAGMYRTRLAGRIAQLTTEGERRVGAVAGAVAVRRVVVSGMPALANVNSPADLEALSRRHDR